ncbi:aminotransferase class I/II-fold pyridoxal phosphate-dependent enzyme [Cohnella sp. CFH 77786]|nr:aminotransferase class I/II-fold pyridoxal phosphate-dependent enzyme [Cohnella sp. CFH 77786]MBW5449071.1 aminotransferase class I/II-fold pyridoxal phosphate-dependent enzyme [Cohnella sp. CFH 77786]
MLANHAGLRAASFHVPGHKQRAIWDDKDADGRYRSLLELDVTELADTDDLHHPGGPIAEAQRLAADCFGAEETRFLVGGSTAGNLAMILGTTAPGDLLIVQRNSHRSVFHGLMLAGVRAVLLQPDIEPASGLAVMPAAYRIREALDRYPEARGVVVCSPNYYGMAANLKPIADICHAAGKPLLVDEAHGPHFGLHPDFPRSALQAGADIAVQSAHKMLSAMTMGAMLHMQGTLVNREAVRQALRMVQSSSPSFPLLASLDLARRQLHVEGTSSFEPALQAVRGVRKLLPQTPFREMGRGGEDSQDPLKLVLFDSERKMDGFRLRDELAARGCIPEMADSRHVVLAFGVGSRKEDADRLVRALNEISDAVSTRHAAPKDVMAEDGAAKYNLAESETDTEPDIPEPVIIHRVLPATERVPLQECAGRIAGEWVVPYPPGIPELYPGEIVTEGIRDRLLQWRRQGASIQGAEDPALKSIRVISQQW